MALWSIFSLGKTIKDPEITGKKSEKHGRYIFKFTQG